MRILFVCMGNICRSPTAEGVMRALLREEGLDGQIELDSAGTGGWHAGDPPDPRAVAAARAPGAAVTSARPTSGGSINEAWELGLDGRRRAFVKTRADAVPGEYATEAAGLRWLAEPGAIELPGVIALSEDDPRFLAL